MRLDGAALGQGKFMLSRPSAGSGPAPQHDEPALPANPNPSWPANAGHPADIAQLPSRPRTRKTLCRACATGSSHRKAFAGHYILLFLSRRASSHDIEILPNGCHLEERKEREGRTVALNAHDDARRRHSFAVDHRRIDVAAIRSSSVSWSPGRRQMASVLALSRGLQRQPLRIIATECGEIALVIAHAAASSWSRRALVQAAPPSKHAGSWVGEVCGWISACEFRRDS